MAVTPLPGSGAMFDRIARRYDLLNRVLSAGLDRRWRRALVDALQAPPGARLLDLAAGTADVSALLARLVAGSRVVGLDPSAGMLGVGARKLRGTEAGARGHLVRADAQVLPFADAAFDGVTMAFGIRNVPDRLRALREMRRVLRPGGRVALLELSEPSSPLARWHVHHVVPRLGAWLSGEAEYRYLQRSIAAFPPPGDFARQLEASGLVDVDVRPMTLGVAHLYTGRVPAAAGEGEP